MRNDTVSSKQEIEKAKALLENGEVVGLPTETVYGLAASIHNEAGIKKIFAVKERPFFDPLIVHVSSVGMAQELVTEWPDAASRLAEAFWPGPLTIVLPKQTVVSDLITSGLDTVALRCPRHEIALALIQQVGPLAAPSANRFGRTSPSSAEHVRAEFGDAVFVVDGGPCAGGIESTVVEVGGADGGVDVVHVLRPGMISIEQLESVLGEGAQVEFVASTSSGSLKTPGHLDHHYQPAVPLVFVDSAAEPLDWHQWEPKLQQCANALERDASRIVELKLGETEPGAGAAAPELVARQLYARMRELSADNPGILYVVRTPSQRAGLWTAIWDRLWKAATVRLASPQDEIE